jgi:SRSO17 transposase
MAAKVDPWHLGSRHQSMHHFVATAPLEQRAVLQAASDYALAQLERHGPVAAWVVDDTGMPKKGRWSVGVGRQYCGALGKQENCQVAVSVSLVNDVASVPCAYRLYLPKEWFGDRQRWEGVGIPAGVRFQTKWEIALEEIDRLQAEQLPQAPVVADRATGRRRPFATDWPPEG